MTFQQTHILTMTRYRVLLLIFASSLYCFSSFAGEAVEIQHPDIPILWESSDPALQQQLEKLIKQQGLWKQVLNKHLAVVVVQINELHNPRLAHLNGNRMYYAASLPKIGILLAAFVEIQAGKLELDSSLHKQLTDMIRYSSNIAASNVLSLVGGERILEILEDPAYGLYDPKHNGGLWVGKEYGKGRAFHRDPLYNYSHGATAVQAARFYYLLETYQLLTPEYSEIMKDILSKPGIPHKFVKGLKQIPGIKIYRKSGTWKNYHADSALVQFKNYKYIIIGLSDSNKGGKWLEQLGLPLHKMVTGDNNEVPKN